MKSSIHHTSLLMINREFGQDTTTAWTFRTGVGIDVKFGMPKYDCRFHGICRLDLDEGDLSTGFVPSCNTGKGCLFIPRPEYCLIFFKKSSMTASTRQAHFQRTFFVLEEAVPFSDRLQEYFHRKITLKTGRYRIMEKDKGYGVLFEIFIH